VIIVDTGPLLAAADSGDDDHQACAALLERHAHELVVPASVVAVAERLGAKRIATLDHRDFTVVRPSHVTAFTLLP
jgi:predicted nucleic acid-binding protein